MSPFIPKKLNQDRSLGEELRRARQNKNLEIDAVAQILNINKNYLLLLEAEDMDRLPAGIYAKSFLKKYANFLSINPDLVNEFINYWEKYENPNPFSQKILKKRRFLVFPKLIRNLILLLIVLAGIIYLLLYVNKIIKPPNLEIYEPSKNMTWQESEILVTGKTDKEAELKINDELILTNNKGEFAQIITLKLGINALEFSAKKKYSKNKIIIRQILLE